MNTTRRTIIGKLAAAIAAIPFIGKLAAKQDEWNPYPDQVGWWFCRAEPEKEAFHIVYVVNPGERATVFLTGSSRVVARGVIKGYSYKLALAPEKKISELTFIRSESEWKSHPDKIGWWIMKYHNGASCVVLVVESGENPLVYQGGSDYHYKESSVGRSWSFVHDYSKEDADWLISVQSHKMSL